MTNIFYFNHPFKCLYVNCTCSLTFSYSGCDPTIMGIGPVPAIRNLLKKTGKELKDIDLVEVGSRLFVVKFQ